MGVLADWVATPLLLPFIALWLLVARILSLLVPLLVIPSVVLARRLYWAVPIGPHVWRRRGTLARLGFEASYCAHVTYRLLTLPLRPYLPSVYILGFPKCGTTALAEYLKQHPAVAGVDGLPWHPVLSKESHFFNGVLGRSNASSPALYRSFFPTLLTGWWRRTARRAGRFFCVDACPLPACLPFAAARIASITPNAKLVFCVRDPLEAAFSVEVLLRNLGLPLDWSFMEDVIAADPRFADTPDDAAFWERLEGLGTGEALPADLPQRLFGRCSSVLRCACFADRVKPFLEVFPRENIMFVELTDLEKDPEKTVNQVLRFIGADPERGKFRPLPVTARSGDRRGRRMHPAVRRKLEHHFAVPNQKLFALMGREYPWGQWQPAAAADEEEGGMPLPVIPVLQVGPGGKPRPKVSPPPSPPPRLLPGAAGPKPGEALGRKDSGLVKRVVSISARV